MFPKGSNTYVKLSEKESNKNQKFISYANDITEHSNGLINHDSIKCCFC